MKDILIALIGAAATIIAAYITRGGNVAKSPKQSNPHDQSNKKPSTHTRKKTSSSRDRYGEVELTEEDYWRIKEYLEKKEYEKLNPHERRRSLKERCKNYDVYENPH